MLDRRVRRAALVALGASIASGTALASTSTWTSSADFLGGALTSTVVDADAVVLDTSGTGRPTASIPWWDATWGQRRCMTITNNEATTLTEYRNRRRPGHVVARRR